MMAQIIDFHERRLSSLVSECSKLVAAMEANTIAEAAAMGLEIERREDGCYRVIDADTGKVRRGRIRNLDWFMEAERDRIANTLGFRNACDIRAMAIVARDGTGDISPEYARAFRYFMATINGEAA